MSMRNIALPLLLTGSSALAVDTTCDPKGSQFQQNLCAVQEAKAAEVEMSALYDRLREARASDPLFTARLESAQQAWIAYKQAELDAAFPCEHEDRTVCFGERTPLCYAKLEAELVRARIAQLQQHLDEAWSGPKCY